MATHSIRIIGIAGTNGSGKDTIGQILATRYNFLFISMTNMLRDELVTRNLPVDRKNMRQLSAEWRRANGLGILIDKAVSEYDTASVGHHYDGLAAASIRNPGEVDRVHELSGVVVWSDAAAKVRYDRIQQNIANRGEIRSIDDKKSFEQFLEEERQEMTSSGDEATLRMSDVKKKADVFIENDGSDIEELVTKLKNALNL